MNHMMILLSNYCCSSMAKRKKLCYKYFHFLHETSNTCNLMFNLIISIQTLKMLNAITNELNNVLIITDVGLRMISD